MGRDGAMAGARASNPEGKIDQTRMVSVNELDEPSNQPPAKEVGRDRVVARWIEKGDVFYFTVLGALSYAQKTIIILHMSICNLSILLFLPFVIVRRQLSTVGTSQLLQ